MFSRFYSIFRGNFKSSTASHTLNSLQRRCFRCCQSLHQKNEIVITKTLQKMLNRGNKKSKNRPYPVPLIKLSPDYVLPSMPSNRPIRNRSQRALKVSAILHRHIEDVMTNQELHPIITELDVQIVEVKTSSDLGSVTVYWSGKSNESDNEEIQEALDICASELRDILISRQVFGHIPYITFVKDKTQAYLEQVDRLLERADYGPGYTPGKWKTAYFPDPSAFNNEEGTLDEEEQDPAPDFSYVNNDIYGLDHDAIAKRLQTSIRKIKNRTKNSDGEIPPEKEVVKKPEFIKSTLRKNFQKKKNKRLEKLSKGFGFSEFERDGFSDLSDYDHDDTDRFDYDEKDYYDDSQYDVNIDNYEDPEDVR